jgi:hypothetical protein
LDKKPLNSHFGVELLPTFWNAGPMYVRTHVEV